ncbi:polypeptide N-acetylgalactosaminyltransferase 1-like [Haliotis asinina]|uniref:polypeptide N-acetylgalactosaminyltransferase 1-like n=1 Tax=Haliotis asinina TaxID=109174 RepID=UPI003531AAC1
MDDIELLAKGETNLKEQVLLVESVSNDIGMTFGLDKCNTLHLKRGKPKTQVNVVLKQLNKYSSLLQPCTRSLSPELIPGMLTCVEVWPACWSAHPLYTLLPKNSSVGHAPLMKTVVTGNFLSNILYGNVSATLANAMLPENRSYTGITERKDSNGGVAEDDKVDDSPVRKVTGDDSLTKETTGGEGHKQVPKTVKREDKVDEGHNRNSVGHAPLMKTVVTGNFLSNILYGNVSATLANAMLPENRSYTGITERKDSNGGVAEDDKVDDSPVRKVTGDDSLTKETTGGEGHKQVPKTVKREDKVDEGHNRNVSILRTEGRDVVLRHVFHGDDGQGQGGAAAREGRMSKAQLERYRLGKRRHRFNEYVSDLISVDRKLPDYRHIQCRDKDYGDQLPDTSVIICFYNEAWSTLLRSVHSVNNTSPPKLLREIILVDDFSDLDDLKKPLDVYMRRFPKVKIIRNIKREGLIRSRLAGVAIARGQTVTFLDSHIECTKGWLPPLLARIKDDTNNVVIPTIGIIHWASFSVIPQNISDIRIGGFSWDLTFRWDTPLKDDVNRRTSVVDPIPSPTMIGGLFSIDRNFFYDIGSYDKGMDLWGGENLDLSFRIWLCGGRLEQAPCSMVAHLFRLSMPYSNTGKSSAKNRERLAKVWLDEYAVYYLERQKTKTDVGDIRQRLQLKKKLNCKSFDWFMKNIYSRGLNPKYATNKGMLKIDLLLKNRCLEGWFLTKCWYRANRMWYFMKSGQIRQGLNCVDFSKGKFILPPCSNSTTQIFRYREDRSLLHVATNTCFSFIMHHGLTLSNCTGQSNQKWTWTME